MDVRIREATPGDVPALTILRRQAVEAAYRDSRDPGDVADIVDRVGGELQARVADDSSTVLVVETEVTAVGYGVVDPATGEVPSLFVSPDYQREGFGGELLSRLQDRVADGTAPRAVAPDHAVGFFEAQGYERVGDAEWHGLPASTLRRSVDR
jgi:N-acetylglutamate synthase-like GNAT family acetyltransferase